MHYWYKMLCCELLEGRMTLEFRLGGSNKRSSSPAPAQSRITHAHWLYFSTLVSAAPTRRLVLEQAQHLPMGILSVKADHLLKELD